MKDARTYERKVKKLLSGTRSRVTPDEAPECLDAQAVEFLVESIVLSETPRDEARKGFEKLREEFVDFNELRVAPVREIAECLGKDHPSAKVKASEITAVLNALYNQLCRMSLAFLKDMPKRDVRRRLRELGCSPFTEARVAQIVFGAHAIPVDSALFEILGLEELVHPDSDIEDTQAFLERVIAQKDGPAASAFFREYVTKHFRTLEKHRQAEAKRLAKEAEAAAKAAAEAEAEKARKEEEKKQRAEQKKAKQAEKAKADKKKADKKKKSAAAKTAKGSTKTTEKKTATKTKTASRKKTTKKAATSKSSQKTASARKSQKKTSKKTAAKKTSTSSRTSSSKKKTK
jgi:outer membrane biosynthesis protein TonB